MAHSSAIIACQSSRMNERASKRMRWKVMETTSYFEYERSKKEVKSHHRKSNTTKLARQRTTFFVRGNFLCKHQSRCKYDGMLNFVIEKKERTLRLQTLWQKTKSAHLSSFESCQTNAPSIQQRFNRLLITKPCLMNMKRASLEGDPGLRNYRAVYRAEKDSQQCLQWQSRGNCNLHHQIVLGISIPTVSRSPQS